MGVAPVGAVGAAPGAVHEASAAATAALLSVDEEGPSG